MFSVFHFRLVAARVKHVKTKKVLLFLVSLLITFGLFQSICECVPDQVGTLAHVGTSSNTGWPKKELSTLFLPRPKVPYMG